MFTCNAPLEPWKGISCRRHIQREAQVLATLCISCGELCCRSDAHVRHCYGKPKPFHNFHGVTCSCDRGRAQSLGFCYRCCPAMLGMNFIVKL